MKVTKQETLYHEDYGATLKHKCGKRIVALSLVYIFLFGLSSLFGLSLFLGQCSMNDGHHTSIYLQLKNYNSILRTRYDSIWMPPAVYRDMQWIKSDMYERIIKVALPQIRCQLHDHAKQYDNDEACHSNGTVVSCMAIYLGMAMEMPW